MTRGAAFFYHIIKPGRYLGGEFGIPGNGDPSHVRDVVWYYPDRYERAITDSAWRRSYFQLTAKQGIRVSRAVEYARDVWASLASSDQATFTLDHLQDISKAASVVFWAPDVLTAAHIPSIIRRIGLSDSRVSIGVVCDGLWIPRFLGGHVDWITPAPDGWLSGDLIAHLRDGGPLPPSAIPGRSRSDFESSIKSWCQQPLATPDASITPRWVPRVEVDDDYFDVELGRIDSTGFKRNRDVASVVLDALDGFKRTGVDGVRFCSSGASDSAVLANVLSELQRRYSMKRVRAHLPAITIEEFQCDWLAFKPHMLKPTVRLTIPDSIDPTAVIETGNRALNNGWQGLTAVMEFDSFEALARLLVPSQTILRGWSQAAQGHADKRLLRIEYKPAPIGIWANAAHEPDDDGARQISSAFRQFKDDISRVAAVGTFRIEDVIARNWLASTDLDIWDRLASLDLSDSNDPDSQAFDWMGWLRQESGMTAPPRTAYLSVSQLQQHVSLEQQTDAIEALQSPTVLEAPSENLFGRRKQRASISHRMVAPPLTRMRVRWAKGMTWRLYSHLDVVRAIERSIRRSGLPASYSEGFHPRLKLSFGPPLAFGLLSDSEYFDLMLEEDYQHSASEKLSRFFPDGLRFDEARGIAAGMPALSDILNEAVYSATIPMELEVAERKLDEFYDRDEVLWSRIGRDDRRPVDPRKTLRHASLEKTAEGTRWELSVVLGGEGNIRPTEWAMLLFGFSRQQLADIIIKRTALGIRRGSTVRTPFETV